MYARAKRHLDVVDEEVGPRTVDPEDLRVELQGVRTAVGKGRDVHRLLVVTQGAAEIRGAVVEGYLVSVDRDFEEIRGAVADDGLEPERERGWKR